MFFGRLPTGTVAMTESAPMSITERSSVPLLLTKRRAPSGLIAAPPGATPTAIVVSTVFVAVSMTDTLSPEAFAVKARAPSGVIAMPRRSGQGGMRDPRGSGRRAPASASERSTLNETPGHPPGP
jgi:hypothetical protein